MKGVAQQMTFADESAEYKAFVEKFMPKKTDDDCYTPDNVYAAILAWAAKRYGFDPACAVRPFWPGGDYERFDYPDGCVVVDNPPFSILMRICRFYRSYGIRFFLFAPALTLFNGKLDHNYVGVGANITYANGAVVSTSFVTNMGGDVLAESAPELRDAIEAADRENRRDKSETVAKYAYPDAVLTATDLCYFSAHHTRFAVGRGDAVFIRALDAQRDAGKTIFGNGFLLSERAAARRAEARREAEGRAEAERSEAREWALSPREREMQRLISKGAAR